MFVLHTVAPLCGLVCSDDVTAAAAAAYLRAPPFLSGDAGRARASTHSHTHSPETVATVLFFVVFK